MKRKIKGIFNIGFDQFFMEEQSFFNVDSASPYVNVYTGWPLPYSEGADDDIGITYRIDPYSIQLSANSVTFRIQAQLSNPDEAIAAFEDGLIAVSYSDSAFGENLYSLGALTDSLMDVTAATDSAQNPLYIVTLQDNPSNVNQFLITISPSVNYDPLLAPQITAGAGFDNIMQVTMIITDCNKSGGIVLSSADMQTGNDYDNDVFGTEDYSSVSTVASPTRITDVLCPPCAGPSITGIGTSDNTTPAESVSIPAGTQDKLLLIYGCGFGTTPGDVDFQNASQDLAAANYCYTNATDIQVWTDNEIALYVPSSTGDPLKPGHPSGSGPFFVRTANNDTIWSPSNITLTIPYAVQNMRNDNGVAVVFYLEQQSEIAHNCYGCCENASNPADPCHTNGYLFTFLDPNSTLFDGYTFPAASFNDVKASFKWAVEQWVCNTGVNFTVSDWLGGNAELNQNDYNNMVLSMQPDGSPAVLPYYANAATHTNPGGFCQTSAAIANTNYTHTFYVTPIVDIDIIFNSSTTANPPNSGSPENYDYVLNDLSGITGDEHPFSTIALHEVGHATALDHVLNGTSEIMYYACGTGSGSIITTLTANDIEGGSYVLDPIGRHYATQTNCTYNPNHANSSYCTYLSIHSPEMGNAEVNVYPNPFEEVININLDLSDKERVSMIVENTLGQEILSFEPLNLESGNYKYTLRLPIAAAVGVYLLKVHLGNETEVFKLIKI